MITTLMNQKRGLTDSVSCPTMEIPGRRKLTETRSKRKTTAESRRAKQQTRSPGPNQPKRTSPCRGHHRARRRPTGAQPKIAAQPPTMIGSKTKHADRRITLKPQPTRPQRVAPLN